MQKNCKIKKEAAWNIVSSNNYTGNVLQQCYMVIESLNQEEKWLRAIDNEEITHELLNDKYGNSELLLKEKHIRELLEGDPFETKAVLKNAIDEFINNV